jgi:hypothetical protein
MILARASLSYDHSFIVLVLRSYCDYDRKLQLYNFYSTDHWLQTAYHKAEKDGQHHFGESHVLPPLRRRLARLGVAGGLPAGAETNKLLRFIKVNNIFFG